MAVVYEDDYKGKSKFGLTIEAVIKKLAKDKTYANITKDTVCEELSNVISGLTDGNVEVTIGAFNYVNAYAQIPMLDNNSPLITRSMTNMNEGLDGDLDYRSFRRRHPSLVGGFDFKKNKFFGWTKELKFKLCLGYRCIYPNKGDNDMSPMVATFILLHEFGHLIEKILGVGCLLRENYVLGQSHAKLMNVKDQKKRIKILREILSEEGIRDSSEIIDVAKDEDTDEMGLYTVMIGKMRGDIRSELDSYGYDQTGSESLADYYATKQGYGMGALYLAKPVGGIIQPDDIHYIVSWALSGGIIAIGMGLGVGGMVSLVGMAYSALFGYSYDTASARYDNSSRRLERVLNAYVESIKSKKTSVTNEEISEVKKMIKCLDAMPRDDRSTFQSIFEYVNPRGRKERNARELQKNLESLSNHRLAIKAAEYSS